MTTRSDQKEARKHQILSAALDLFIRRGYTATRITDIAKAAGMSTGLMFHYYESKAQLYTELVRLGCSAPTDMVNSIANSSPIDFFRNCAQLTLKYAAESSFTAKMFVLMNSAYYNESTPEEARKLALSSDFCRGLAPLIEKGQELGQIRSGNPVALCTTFWSAIQTSIQAHALSPDLPLPEAEWIVDIIANKQNIEKK